MRLALAVLLCLFCAAPALAAETKDMPFRADSGLTKAEAQLAEGLYMQGLDTLARVLERHPGDSDALTYSGYAWYRLGDVRQAQGYFDRALKYNPQHLGANKYKADLFLDAGDLQRAVEQMQVLRMVCVNADCAELNALQSAINAYKAGTREKPKAG